MEPKENLSRRLLTEPADHIHFLDNQVYAGSSYRIIGTKDQNLINTEKVQYVQFPYEIQNLKECIQIFANSVDTYITPNTFRTKSRTNNSIKQINFHFLDFDPIEESQIDNTESWSDSILNRVAELGIPYPSLRVFTGRGFHLYWRIQPVNLDKQDIWNRQQRALAISLGADMNSIDLSRILRLIGTRNSKRSDFKVYGEVLDETILQLEDFSIPQISDTCCAAGKMFTACANKRFASNDPILKNKKSNREFRFNNVVSFYKSVSHDIDMIARALTKNKLVGVPEGNRTNLLYFKAVALSWFTPVDQLEEKIENWASEFIPSMPINEVRSSTSTVVRRAKQADAESRGLFGGTPASQSKTYRYKFRRATLWRRLKNHIPSTLVDQLKAIVPPEEAKRRATERDKNRDRTKEGRYLDRNTGLGVREKDLEKKSTAREMYHKGYPQSRIAKELSVSQPTVSRWLRGETGRLQ